MASVASSFRRRVSRSQCGTTGGRRSRIAPCRRRRRLRNWAASRSRKASKDKFPKDEAVVEVLKAGFPEKLASANSEEVFPRSLSRCLDAVQLTEMPLLISLERQCSRKLGGSEYSEIASCDNSAVQLKKMPLLMGLERLRSQKPSGTEFYEDGEADTGKNGRSTNKHARSKRPSAQSPPGRQAAPEQDPFTIDVRGQTAEVDSTAEKTGGSTKRKRLKRTESDPFCFDVVGDISEVSPGGVSTSDCHSPGVVSTTDSNSKLRRHASPIPRSDVADAARIYFPGFQPSDLSSLQPEASPTTVSTVVCSSPGPSASPLPGNENPVSVWRCAPKAQSSNLVNRQPEVVSEVLPAENAVSDDRVKFEFLEGYKAETRAANQKLRIRSKNVRYYADEGKGSGSNRHTDDGYLTRSGAKAMCVVCCQAGHLAHDCVLNRCYLCFETGHVARQCPHNHSCERCGSKGHEASQCLYDAMVNAARKRNWDAVHCARCGELGHPMCMSEKQLAKHEENVAAKTRRAEEVADALIGRNSKSPKTSPKQQDWESNYACVSNGGNPTRNKNWKDYATADSSPHEARANKRWWDTSWQKNTPPPKKYRNSSWDQDSWNNGSWGGQETPRTKETKPWNNSGSWGGQETPRTKESKSWDNGAWSGQETPRAKQSKSWYSNKADSYSPVKAKRSQNESSQARRQLREKISHQRGRNGLHEATKAKRKF